MNLFLNKKLNFALFILVFVSLIIGIFLVFFSEVRNLVLKNHIDKEITPEGVLDHSRFGWVESSGLEIIFNRNTTYTQRIETLERFNATTSSEYGAKSWGENGSYKLMDEPTQEEYDALFKVLGNDPNVMFVHPLLILYH